MALLVITHKFSREVAVQTNTLLYAIALLTDPP